MKKTKIFVILSMTITLIAMVSIGYFYVEQKNNATNLISINMEMEQTILKKEAVNSNLLGVLKEITPLIPNNNYILKNKTIILTTNSEFEGLVQNIFSPIESQRISSTEILKTQWTKEEKLIPYLLDYCSGRFGQESYNIDGINNAIIVLNSMDDKLIEQNRHRILQFSNKATKLNDRNDTQHLLKTVVQRNTRNLNVKADSTKKILNQNQLKSNIKVQRKKN